MRKPWLLYYGFLIALNTFFGAVAISAGSPIAAIFAGIGLVTCLSALAVEAYYD